MSKVLMILASYLIAAAAWAGSDQHLPNQGKGCVLESSFGDTMQCQQYAELWSCPWLTSSGVTQRRYLLSGVMETQRIDAHESVGYCQPSYFWVQKVPLQNER